MPLIATLFHYGRFSARRLDDARGAGRLQPRAGRMILVKILAPAFTPAERGDAVKIGLATLAATQLMNLAFIGRSSTPARARARPGACLNAFLLY